MGLCRKWGGDSRWGTIHKAGARWGKGNNGARANTRGGKVGREWGWGSGHRKVTPENMLC